MCLFPISVKNPTRCISDCGGQQLVFDIPCGKCAECIEQKKNEWYFRTYQQIQDVLNSGGYAYYDTLTYREDDVPRLSHSLDIEKYGVDDFYVFNHSDFKLFFKNLRRQLSYHYGKIDIKYFLTSEYGTDDRFTHRPHYHIIFFVYGRIHPFAFSRLVAKCWHKGITDGIDYKPTLHVAEHVYGYDLGYGTRDDFNNCCKACSYVSKYITKDSDFQQELDKRINILEGLDIDDEELTILKRDISQFHRQSRGFGLSYVDKLDEYTLKDVNDGVCCMRDDEKIVNVIPLPMYYKRHLFYVNKKREDGSRYWQLTSNGVDFKIKSLTRAVENQIQRYDNIYASITEEERNLVANLLNGRSIEVFAIYKVFYKNRLRCPESYSLKNHHVDNDLSFFEQDLHAWLYQIRNSLFNNETSHYNVFADFVIAHDHNIDYKTFIKKFTFNQNSFYLFKDFDTLDSFFDRYSRRLGLEKQKSYEYEKLYKKRMRYIQTLS